MATARQTEPESLSRLFNASLGGGNIPPEAAERFIITFDRADAAWLRGYTHLLSALIEFRLAHDGKASFDVSAHMLFPDAGPAQCHPQPPAGQPDRICRMARSCRFIAAIHLMHWQVTEPER